MDEEKIDIDAHSSQGFVNHPQEAVNQQFGDAQNVGTDGGDAAGQDFHKTIINFNVTVPSASPSASGQLMQELVQILSQVGNGDSIRQAYRDALPPDWEVSRSEVTEYPDIVSQLEEFGRVLEFVLQLAGSENISQSVRTQLDELIERTIPHDRKKEPIPQVSSNTPVLQSYLLVKVCPDLGTTDRFFINAWLVSDDTNRDRAKRFKPLDFNKQQKGISHSLEQAPVLINQFLKASLKHLLGRQHELTVEIFLPSDYLCVAADLWQALDSQGDQFSIGREYKVVVRSYERLSEDYLAEKLNQWRNNWDRVQQALKTVPGDDAFEHLAQIDGCNWKRLVVNLTQKLGLKLTCVPSALKHRDLFKAMLKAATPIAIWSRGDLPDICLASEIHELLTRGPLIKLSQHILEKRLEADLADNPEGHLGYHLSILWEDPYRLTPDATALLPPGQ